VWWAGCLLLAATVAGLGLRGSLRPAALGSVVAGLAALAYAVGVVADSGPLDARGFLRALAGTQPWQVLSGLAALAAGWYALRRRAAADLALGIAGACLALYAGAANAGAFAHGVPPVPLPGGTARLLVLLALGTGAGLAGLCGLRMWRSTTARPAPVRAQNSIAAGTLPS
jgi:hypothetical protein